MIKVFLVEDEFVIREGIKKNIDWTGNGYEFCGEASDGELAYPMIKKEKPDIVITDIRMPFMNGLELSKLIKKEMPWIEIIILSGFEEFEYAKEAINIGVAQYLTKPISGDDLLKELNDLSTKIEESKREREVREKYLSEMKENTISERKVFFEKLVTGSQPSIELIQAAEKLEMNITAIYYNILLAKSNAGSHSQEEFSNRQLLIEEEIESIIDEDYIIMFDRDLEGKAFLFKADTKEQLDKNIDSFVEKLKEIFNKYEGIGYFGGFIPGIPMPTPFFIAVICVIVITLVLKFTTLGLYTQSVGINESSSKLNGLNPQVIKLITFVILGLCVAVVGLIKVSRISTINYSVIAKDIEMDAILAVALGGNALSGGKFNMYASILGAYIIQFLTTTLYKYKVSADALPAYKAVVVILLVVFSAPTVREWMSKTFNNMKNKSAKKEVA